MLPITAYVVLRTSIVALGRQYIPGYSGPFLRARIDIVRHNDSPEVFIMNALKPAEIQGIELDFASF